MPDLTSVKVVPFLAWIQSLDPLFAVAYMWVNLSCFKKYFNNVKCPSTAVPLCTQPQTYSATDGISGLHTH